MKKYLLTLILLTILLSSGCANLTDSDSNSEPEVLVEEGNTLVFESNRGTKVDVVFFNETEESIGVHFANRNFPTTANISKETWLSEKGAKGIFTLSGSYRNIDRNKFESLMRDGEELDLYGSKISRSDQFNWKGFQAYNISRESEDESTKLIVHSREPYLIISNPGSGELISVNETDSLENYGIGEESKAMLTTPAAQKDFEKIFQTDLEVMTAFRATGDDHDQIMINIRNTGERTLDLGNFEVYYGPPRFLPVAFRTLRSQSEWTVADNNCLPEEQELSPGEALTCGTGVKFPSFGQQVKIRVNSENFDWETTYSCEPATNKSQTC